MTRSTSWTSAPGADGPHPRWLAARALCLGLLAGGCVAADSSLDEAAVAALACEVAGVAALPPLVRETSGLAAGDAGVLWTHNDRGHEPYIHAVDTAGTLIRSVPVAGVSSLDWEDIERAPCAGGECIYIADIGDNDGVRASIAVHVVNQPQPGSSDPLPARTMVMRYPDRPQDAEAMFILDRTIYIVTKGEHGPITLYRGPSVTDARPATEDASANPPTLIPIRQLGARRLREPGKVTGASASPDGHWVAIRSYDALHLFDAASLVGQQPLTPYRFDLRPLREPQGEGVLLMDDGTVWLTSESESGAAPPRLTHLRCELPPHN